MVIAPARERPRFCEDRRVGGAARTDAWLTICHVGNAGLCRVDSVEPDEQRQPLVVHARRLLPDTEGTGTQVGARSSEVGSGPEGCTISAAYVSDGKANPPQGGAAAACPATPRPRASWPMPRGGCHGCRTVRG